MVYQKGWEFYVEPILKELPKDIEMLRISNNSNPRLFNPLYIWQSLKIAIQLRKAQIDLIHVQFFFPFLGYFLIFLKCPLVITLHEIEPRNLKGGLYGRISAFLLWCVIFLAPLLIRKSQRVIVLSESLKERLSENKPNLKVDFIPIGTTNYGKDDSNEQPRTVLFFGNVWWSKGLDILLKSMLASNLRDVKLVIAGDGKMPGEWLDLIEKGMVRFDIDLRNRHIGESEMHQLFSECTLVVLPYRSASTSSVLSTAFAYGKPVVASKTEYFLEVVKDGVTGFLADEAQFADRINRLIEDQALRLQMKRNIERYMNTRSWHRIAELHYQTYKEAMTVS